MLCYGSWSIGDLHGDVCFRNLNLFFDQIRVETLWLFYLISLLASSQQASHPAASQQPDFYAFRTGFSGSIEYWMRLISGKYWCAKPLVEQNRIRESSGWERRITWLETWVIWLRISRFTQFLVGTHWHWFGLFSDLCEFPRCAMSPRCEVSSALLSLIWKHSIYHFKNELRDPGSKSQVLRLTHDKKSPNAWRLRFW